MKPTRRNKLYVRLTAHIDIYITSACKQFSHNFRHITEDDLKQECAIKLLQIIDKIPNFTKIPEEEILSIFKSSIFNLLRDIYRSHKNSFTSILDVNDDDEEGKIKFDMTDTSFDGFEEVVFNQYKESILFNLSSELEKQAFLLILQPDEILINYAVNDYQSAELKRKRGKMVMNLNEVHLQHKHYAKRLKVSSATMSRIMKHIRQISASILVKQ